MSKRFADAQGGSARYGGPDMPDTPDDPPRKATAAQLAKRSIKPMKNRAAASRSASPSKAPPTPSLNSAFGGVPQQPQFSSNGFGGFNSPTPQSPQPQSGPQPPTASSFTFGAPQQQSNPFGGLQASSFPPAPSFGQNNATASSFSPAKAPVSFNFGGGGGGGGGQSTNTPSAAPFSFGASTPTKPAEEAKTNGTPAFANVFQSQKPTAGSPAPTNMFGQSQQQPTSGLSDAEVKEIEDAAPRLQAEGRLADLEKLVREHSVKYKNAPSLAGFNPRELDEHAQRKMLDFVRNPASTKNANLSSQPTPQSPAPTAPSTFGSQAQTTSAPAPPANPFAKLDRPTTPTSPVSFGAQPATSSTPFQFGAPATAAAATPKPAGEVSYPKLNLNGTSSQAESAASSPAPFFGSKPSETPKPASPGLGQSMFGNGTAGPAAATPFKFGGPAPASASNNDSAPAPAAKPFQFGAPAAAPAAAPAPFSPAPAPQQANTPAKINFAPSLTTQQDSTPSSDGFRGFGSGPAAASSSASGTLSNGEPQKSAPRVPAALSQKNRELNEALKKHLTTLDTAQDWAHVMRHFLDQHKKIAQDARNGTTAGPDSRPTTSNGVSTPSGRVQAQAPAPPASSFANKRKAEEEVDRDDLGKRSKATTDFSQSLSAASPNKPLSQTASLFDDILNTPPKQATPAPQPPATAPAAPRAETPKANPFAKLTKVNNTPAAPPAETPKPASSLFSVKPSSAAPEPAKAAAPAASAFSFKPSTADESAKTAAPAAASSPFKINPPSTSTSSAPAAPAFQLPKFGGGAAATGTPNFMSAFGARAAEQEKKDKEKRKMEDFDSDDDDEEEWEKKDAEEQAAKRKKLLEGAAAVAAPLFKPSTTSASSSSSAAPTFKFGGANNAKTAATPPTTAASAGSSNIFGHLSGSQTPQDDEEEESDEDAQAEETITSTPAKSLFDRVDKPAAADKPAVAASNGTGFKFGGGSSSNVFGNTASPGTDHTWGGETNTPIKFGAKSSAANDAGSTTPTGSPAKAAFGGFSTTGTSSPKFGGFTASSIHDKPAAPKLAFGNNSSSSSQPPFAGLFGAGKSATEAKNTPASPAASGLNASIFSPATKPSAGFTFGGPKSSGSPSASGAPAASTTSSVFGAPVASTTSSVFGNSAATSGATTPANNTDTESKDENEPSDEPKDAQQGDLTALTPEEAAANDVLFETKTKASQFTKAAPDDAKLSWVPKGLGILRLLKNKETGKCHSTLRLSPGGRVLLNFGLLGKKVPNAYVAHGKMARLSISDAEGKLSTWTLTMKDPELVKDFVNKLEANRPE